LAKSRILARSVRMRKRPGWLLPPFGALTAASIRSWRSSTGMGSGRNLRHDRCVNIVSPTGIDSRE
jgi:hypothetical protein